MCNRVVWRVCSSLAVGSFLVIGLAGEAPGQGLKVSGYGDLEWTLQQTGDPDNEWHHFFDNHHINLVLVGWIVDDLQVGVEVEYEHAGEEIALEYGYLAYTGIRNVRLIGGKFIIPFNRWNKDLHPTWISKMPGRPPVYSNVFPSTYSDVGVWVTGGLPVANRSRVTFDAYVVNGLKGDPDETNWRDLRGNDRERPDMDNNKALGGRLGVELPQGIAVGASVYRGKYAADPVTDDNLNMTFLGGDFDLIWRGIDLRGEVVYATQQTTGDDTNRWGFYGQVAYNLAEAGATGFLADVEPVVRFTVADFAGDASDTKELGIGASYYVSASAALRIAYFLVSEDEGFKQDNNRLMTQFAVVF